MVNCRNILFLVVLFLLPCLVEGQSGFDSYTLTGTQTNPFILFSSAAEHDTIIDRCNGTHKREPYITWYGQIKSEFAQRAYDGTSVASHDAFDEGIIALYGSFIYMLENDSTEARDSAKVAMANYDAGGEFNSAETVVWKATGMDILLYEGQISAGEKDAIQDNLMNIQGLWLPIPGTYNNGTTRRSAASIIVALSVDDRDHSWAQDKLDDALVLADSLYSYATDSTGLWWEGPLYVEFGCRLMLVADNAFRNATTRDFMDDDYFPLFLEFYGKSKRSKNNRDWPFDDSKHRTKGTQLALINESIFGTTVPTLTASQYVSIDKSTFKVWPMTPYTTSWYNDLIAPDTTGVPSYGNEDAGVAILRDWWNGSGYEFIFLSEPFNLDSHSNHEHWDTNSLFGFFGDAFAVVDPGYGQVPPGSFDHNDNFKDFSAHNVLRVNETDGTTDKNGEFNHYLLEHLVCYVEGHSDLFSHSWDRGVLFWGGHWFMVFDWVTDTDADNQYKWQWILPGQVSSTSWSESLSQQRIRTDTLGIETYVFQSLFNSSTIDNDDWRYEYTDNVYGGARRHVWYHYYNTTSEDTVSIFTIQSFTSGGTPITVAESGSVVKTNLAADTLRAAVQLTNSVIDGSLLKGNGKMMAIADSAGTVEMFSVTDCDSLLYNSNYLYSSNTNVDAFVMAMKDEQRYENRIRGIVENSTQPYTVSIYTGYKPLWVKVNDVQLSGTWDGEKITFTVSSTGRQSIEMSIPQKNAGDVF